MPLKSYELVKLRIVMKMFWVINTDCIPKVTRLLNKFLACMLYIRTHNSVSCGQVQLAQQTSVYFTGTKKMLFHVFVVQ